MVQQRLDPNSSLSSSALGRAYYRDKQFEPAIAAFNKAIAVDRTYVPNYARLANVYIALGRYDDALHWLDEGQKTGGGTRRQSDGYGVAYALAGRRPEAEAARRDLIAQFGETDQVLVSLAYIDAALGHHDAAIESLNRAFDNKSARLFLINGEMKLDALRGHAGFQDLLRRMHFPN